MHILDSLDVLFGSGLLRICGKLLTVDRYKVIPSGLTTPKYRTLHLAQIIPIPVKTATVAALKSFDHAEMYNLRI